MVKLGKGFVDLNIPYEEGNHKEVRRILERGFSLGYETLSVNVEVHQNELKTKTQLKKSEGFSDFPGPPVMDGFPGKTILTRLTLTVSDNSFLPLYNNSKTAKKYDLVSIIPESLSTLQNLIKSSFRPDILTFDSDNISSIRWSRKLINEIAPFCMLELLYAPCIRDSGLRKKYIAIGHHLKSLKRPSKPLIVSSGALRPIELRAPHDVINLGFIFGLSEAQGREAVRENAHMAIRFGAGRRIGPFRALVRKKKELTEEERSLLGNNDESSSSSSEDESENIDEPMN